MGERQKIGCGLHEGEHVEVLGHGRGHHGRDRRPLCVAEGSVCQAIGFR